MSGWLLIIILLLLGGVLSTLGDRLGSFVGKARLSVFNLRPRRTAVLITVFTGSLISALSLGLMLLVSQQLRVGLFELDDLQDKLKKSRQALAPLKKERKFLEKKIISSEKELKQLENNLIAFRRGNVVITSGQLLASNTFQVDKDTNFKKTIEGLLQKANLEAYRRVLPGEKPNRQILLVPRSDVQRLENIVANKGTWVINLRSAANVLGGEKFVYAYPEVRPNITIAREDELLSKITLNSNESDSEIVVKKIRLLLASTMAEIKRRGSLSTRIEFDSQQINQIVNLLVNREETDVEINSVSIKNSYTSDIVSVILSIKNLNIDQVTSKS